MHTADTERAEPATGLPLTAAIALQDELMTACHDLERLQGLLATTYADLSEGFRGTSELIATQRDGGSADAASVQRLAQIEQRLARAITALQFEDMASQLITHTRLRLRRSADRLALDTLADDEDGEGILEEAPLRPNPVTQDEMDAGSIELF